MLRVAALAGARTGMASHDYAGHMHKWDELHFERIRAGLIAWFAVKQPRPALAQHPRSVRDPRLRSHAPTDPGQPGLPYYARWLEIFPNVQALASASTADVIRTWSGLGYNRRAIYLQKTARAVVDDYGGVFPSTPDTLRKLPGIGPYTAGAIAAFAFERDVAFLDTNMRRVVHRLLYGSDIPARQVTERELLATADRMVGEGTGWLWNQALIEFGALQCTQRRPACFVCPLSGECAAYPVIQSELAAMPPGTRLKNEGKFHGSNRQYRGRVVEGDSAVPSESHSRNWDRASKPISVRQIANGCLDWSAGLPVMVFLPSANLRASTTPAIRQQTWSSRSRIKAWARERLCPRNWLGIPE